MSDPVAKQLKMDVESGSEVQRVIQPREICNLSTQKFSEIVGLAAFVDKTLFIKALFKEASGLVILAPRKFGKSTNMDMVREFVSGNKKLFEDNKLKIYEEERDFFNENCQKNPVINVDFKSVGGNTHDAVLQSLKIAIAAAYDEHKYLVKEDGENYVWSDEKFNNTCYSVNRFVNYWKKPENISQTNVIFGLTHLSDLLHKYYDKRVYVFIDEYDAPMMEAIMRTSLEDKVLRKTNCVINEMMCSFLKGNRHVKRVLINACIRVEEMCYTHANNIVYYEFLKEPAFLPYFGFTDKEVEDLFERDEFKTLKNDDVKKWYNGYRVKRTDEFVIYNSYSILAYLGKSRKMNKPQLDSYWVDTESITYPNELFAKTEIRRPFEKLVNDEEVVIETTTKYSKDKLLSLNVMLHQQLEQPRTFDADLFLQFLSENGYLNVVKETYRFPTTSTLKVPNEEIKRHLIGKCYCAKFFQRKYQLSCEKIRNFVERLCLILQQRDRDSFITFAKAVSELFDTSLPSNEDELHSVLFTLLYNFKEYKVQSEMSVQRMKKIKDLDILLILGDVGMVIELRGKSSEIAHTQILTEEYVTTFDDNRNIAMKILLGLHMNQNREVSLTYTIDNSVKQTVTSND